MYKTIWVMVATIFAVISIGILMGIVFNVLDQNKYKEEFLDIQKTVEGHNLTISWRTETATDGKVIGNNDVIGRDIKFSKVHKIEIYDISGSIYYYIQACDVSGNCYDSEEMSDNFG